MNRRPPAVQHSRLLGHPFHAAPKWKPSGIPIAHVLTTMDDGQFQLSFFSPRAGPRRSGEGCFRPKAAYSAIQVVTAIINCIYFNSLINTMPYDESQHSENPNRGRLKHGVIIVGLFLGMFLLFNTASTLFAISGGRVPLIEFKKQGVGFMLALFPGLLLGVGTSKFLKSKIDDSFNFHIKSLHLNIFLGLFFSLIWFVPGIIHRGCVSLAPGIVNSFQQDLRVSCYFIISIIEKIEYGLLFGTLIWTYIWIVRTEKKTGLPITVVVYSPNQWKIGECPVFALLGIGIFVVFLIFVFYRVFSLN